MLWPTAYGFLNCDVALRFQLDAKWNGYVRQCCTNTYFM